MRAATTAITIALTLVSGRRAVQHPSGTNSARAGAPMFAGNFTLLERADAAAPTAHCADCHDISAAGLDGVSPALIHKTNAFVYHGDLSL